MAKNQDLVFTEFYAPHLNGGRKNNIANNRQAITERMYMRMLAEMAANRFEWKGLPDSVDARFLELNCLTYRGLAVFYYDDDAGKHFAVQGSGAGATNFLDNPVSFTVIGPGIGAGNGKTLQALPQRGENGERFEPECVPIWANYMRGTDWDIITLYAHKLAKVDRTIEITMDNMRKTKVVAAPESERLSYVNILKQIGEGQDAIFGTRAMAELGDSLTVLDLGVDPLTLPNLQIGRSKLWSECMGLLGINNANQDKKERLVAAEVGANDEQVQATRNIALNARQFACEAINKRWPELNISVDFRMPPIDESQSVDGKQDDAGKDEN
jgi:hypothetical protein